MPINVNDIPLNEGFKDVIMTLPPPASTYPYECLSSKDSEIYLKLPRIKDSPQQQSFCGDEYVYEVYDMSTYPEAPNAEKGQLRGAENIDAYFWSAPNNIRKKLGEMFYDKCRSRRKDVWNAHCKQKLAKKIGPGSFYPKPEVLKKKPPSYSLVGAQSQPKYVRYPGPADYSIKRQPINEKSKSCSFKGPNWSVPKKELLQFYDTTKHKALGKEPKHTFIGKPIKCRRQYQTVYNEKIYKPTLPSKTGWSFGLKNEVDPFIVDNYYRAVSPSVIKKKNPLYTVVGDRNIRKRGLKHESSPADYYPNLSYKPVAPKYTMKFQPKMFTRDRFGDIKEVDNGKKSAKRNLGPGSYNVPLDTNDFRSHLFNYRFYGSCILESRQE